MKHAFIITAYKDFDLLDRMLSIYTEKYDIDCYVHIDKRNKDLRSVIKRLNAIPNVVAISKYRVNWGSIYHPLCMMELLKIASGKGYDYFHFIPANAFIGVSPEKFHSFWKNKDMSFVEHIDFKGSASEKDLREWYEYYHFAHIYNKKGAHASLVDNIEYYGIKIQKKLGIKRKVDFDYKGYLYCHLTNEAVSFVIDYLRTHRKYIRQLKYCHVCEEFFFQNILLNSVFSNRIVNDSLIFDDWSEERERPAVLNLSDFDTFLSSDKIFLRKIEDRPDSMELFEKIISGM